MSTRAVVRTARSLGLSTVGWNVDPTDYAQPGTATIVRRVLEQVRPGSIIISHDGGGPRGQTLAAYPQIIATLPSPRLSHRHDPSAARLSPDL